MRSIVKRIQYLVILLLLLAGGCHLDQGSAMPAPDWLGSVGQNVQVFIEDFARQALAAFLF